MLDCQYAILFFLVGHIYVIYSLAFFVTLFELLGEVERRKKEEPCEVTNSTFV